ncbi:ComF family protein [Zavarzinia compransoris]|uniref:ComF family protein n=1 Tax=Zavarzinia marina TaxID=2911065 RepID=UPI001F23532F|nr:ComF family protein [Zavarzinia marina]MCF4167044.1 ComF family protein [Zavarzinia marina]
MAGRGLSSLWRRGGGRVLDFLLPASCLACDAPVDAPGRLCPSCWPEVGFISAPCCDCCGLPFELPVPPGTRCGACIAHPPRFTRARAVARYGGSIRDLLLRFKHADRLDLAPSLARLLAQAGGDCLAGADFLVPVPLHWRRRLRRRYNQSAELARHLGGLADVPVLHGALSRARATPAQGRLGRLARMRNVARAFVVPERARGRIAGRHLVLIDDVFTTGATADACCRALLAAGAARVDVLTVARVVRDADGS